MIDRNAPCRSAALATLAAVLVAASGLVQAGEGPPPKDGDASASKAREAEEPEEKRARVSAWGRDVLDRCERIALGKVRKRIQLPTGLTSVSFEIEEAMFGPGAEGERILVVTPDPRYFRQEERLVLFLVRKERDRAFHPLDKIDIEASGGEVRLAAVRRFLAIEAMKDPEARLKALKEILFEHLPSPDRWCRENAIREIYILTEREPESFTDKEAERIRTEALARKRDDAEINLLYALGHLEVIPPLRRAVREEGGKGLAELAALLEEKGCPARRIRIREDVIFQQYRAEPDPRRRAAIVGVAADLHRPRLYAGVIKALWDGHILVRLEAVRGLRRYGSPRASRAVAKKLSDPYPALRLEAVRTLIVIGTRAQLPLLRSLASDDAETEEIRRAARTAVEAIEGR